MIAKVGCASSTPSIAWSSFTTSVDSKTKERKTVQSWGSTECGDNVWRNNCIWQPMGSLIKSVQNLSSEGGRMWKLNRLLSTPSHVTLWGWSFLRRRRQTVTCDSNYVYLWLCSSITDVRWVGFELFLHFWTNLFVIEILISFNKVLEFHLTFQSFKREMTGVPPKFFNRFTIGLLLF